MVDSAKSRPDGAPAGKETERQRVRKTPEAIRQDNIDSVKSVFDHTTFQNALVSDMRGAQGRVIIHDPYVTVGGVERYAPMLKACLHRGVRICVFVQAPRGWDTRHDSQLSLELRTKYQKVEMALDLLGSWGVHCNLLENIHEKLVIIDENVLWEGSLNVLSHFNTSERMIRWTSRQEVARAVFKHGLDQCRWCGKASLLPVSEHLRLLGRRIRQRRLALGISQQELGRRSGKAQATISEIELGKHNIALSGMLQVARVLDLHLMLVPECLLQAVEERVAKIHDLANV